MLHAFTHTIHVRLYTHHTKAQIQTDILPKAPVSIADSTNVVEQRRELTFQSQGTWFFTAGKHSGLHPALPPALLSWHHSL